MWETKENNQERKREWNDAVGRAKKELGFSPNEFVEDWSSVVAMAKAMLAEDRGDVHNKGNARPRGANDKTILAHYLSGKPIQERFLVRMKGVQV